MTDWSEFQKHTWFSADGRFGVDYSLLLGGASDTQKSSNLFEAALRDMQATEKGELVNSDENRMVGHYWLRDSSIAPDEQLRSAIEDEIAHVTSFVSSVHKGQTVSISGKKFRSLLLVGIGGSALGPQLLSAAFQNPSQPMELFSLDNTDPDGIACTLSSIPSLEETLVLVVSKSGGTKETRNGMLLVEEAFSRAKIDFAKHAVAVTGEGSLLFQKAREEKWLEIFPMWDWVGGRTSIWSSVGLLPAALLGVDIDALLAGARTMDSYTRAEKIENNPAGILAHGWLQFSQSKDMVVLPYKDRMLLLSRYLQQLVMESLGKEFDRDGKRVEEGISVYGNKGSTDQHAYVQQLRDGRNNFFAVFIEVLEDFASLSLPSSDLESLQQSCITPVEEGVNAGDYLHGFYLGTREALAEKKRSSLTITIPDVSAFSLGALIALFERAVSFYASFVNINAYHQPGVEAGKKAAGRVLELQSKILSALRDAKEPMSVEQIGEATKSEELVHIFKIVERLSATGVLKKQPRKTMYDGVYGLAE